MTLHKGHPLENPFAVFTTYMEMNWPSEARNRANSMRAPSWSSICSKVRLPITASTEGDPGSGGYHGQG